jgi:hypothetical protein
MEQVASSDWLVGQALWSLLYYRLNWRFQWCISAMGYAGTSTNPREFGKGRTLKSSEVREYSVYADERFDDRFCQKFLYNLCTWIYCRFGIAEE